MPEILDENDFVRLKDSLKQIEETKKAIQKAKQAKIDLTEQEKVITDYEQKIRAILQAYFPGR